MKKPADFLCQRAALPIALGGLSIRPLTRHPGVEMMMVVCQCAQHESIDYRADLKPVNTEFALGHSERSFGVRAACCRTCPSQLAGWDYRS
jgi:hypothetical protein